MLRSLHRGWPLAAVLALAACGDTSPTAAPEQVALDGPVQAIQALDCVATISSGSVSCGAPRASSAGGASRVMIGGQNVYVRLSSSNISMAGGIFQMDVTVQNLLNEAIGTPDGVTPAADGIMVFFQMEPATTAGSGLVSLANVDGTAFFMGPNQPYFTYTGILSKDQVSAPKTWQFAYDPAVESFRFQVYVATEVQPLLVINEVMANPQGAAATPTSDLDREWFEVYNAGTLPVQMQGMVIADSAGSGRRPYHLIASDLNVAPGGYMVLGSSTNTTNNGGVPVDYAYGVAMNFANSLDALKISRVYGTDTLTIDRTQYSSAAVSAQAGISRELKNPALDNSNMDGSNWDNASVVSVYGDGGRGTPKAQNSVYTP